MTGYRVKKKMREKGKNDVSADMHTWKHNRFYVISANIELYRYAATETVIITASG